MTVSVLPVSAAPVCGLLPKRKPADAERRNAADDVPAEHELEPARKNEGDLR